MQCRVHLFSPEYFPPFLSTRVDEGIMTHFSKNVSCSVALALADFVSFVLSLYLALGVLSVTLPDFHQRVPKNQIEGWIGLHWLLGACCVVWYGVRLRHYF